MVFDDTLFTELFFGGLLRFLSWTGDLLLTVLSFGNYRREKGRFVASVASVTIGVVFWAVVGILLFRLI